MIPTPEENKQRLEEIRKKLLEAIDLTLSWEETEQRKKNATPTEFQTKDEDFTEEDFQDETEEEELDE